MRLDSDILIDSALTHTHRRTHTRTQTHSHTQTHHAHSHKFGTEQLSSVGFFWLYRRRTCLPLHPTPHQREREREGMNSFLLPPPFPGLFYDVCQRQHRLQKVFRAGPKLSEVQQPSGKRSGHCGWSGRRMMPSPPTFHLQLVSFSCPPFSLACSLFAFGFRLSTPCTSAGCEQDSSIRAEEFAHTIYMQYIYMCVSISMSVLPPPQ